MRLVKASKKLVKFDPETFLSTINGGRKIVAFPKEQTIFARVTRSMRFFIFRRER